MELSMNSREKAVAVELFCSAAVQQQVAFGQFKIGGGEDGSFAALCGKAAKTFCEVSEGLALNPQVTAVALKVFAHFPGAVSRIGEHDRRQIAQAAFRRAEEFFESFKEPEIQVPVPEVPLREVPGREVPAPKLPPSAVALSEIEKPRSTQASAKVLKPEGERVPAAERQSREPALNELAGGVDGELEDVAVEHLDLPQKTIDLLLSLSTTERDLTSARKIRAADAKQSIEKLEYIGVAIRKKILEAVEKAIGPVVAE